MARCKHPVESVLVLRFYVASGGWKVLCSQDRLVGWQKNPLPLYRPQERLIFWCGRCGALKRRQTWKLPHAKAPPSTIEAEGIIVR